MCFIIRMSSAAEIRWPGFQSFTRSVFTIVCPPIAKPIPSNTLSSIMSMITISCCVNEREARIHLSETNLLSRESSKHSLPAQIVPSWIAPTFLSIWEVTRRNQPSGNSKSSSTKTKYSVSTRSMPNVLFLARFSPLRQTMTDSKCFLMTSTVSSWLRRSTTMKWWTGISRFMLSRHFSKKGLLLFQVHITTSNEVSFISGFF